MRPIRIHSTLAAGSLGAALLILPAAFLLQQPLTAQQPGGRGGAPQTGKSTAPIDITGTWSSVIVDEWRFRVTPQKGDIVYLPLKPEARNAAQAWDPSKDEAEGKACKAYGAVGIMQRPGRFRISWQDDNTLKIEADTGTQTRLIHFGPEPADKGQASWQGYSTAVWALPNGAVINLGSTGQAPALGGGRGGRGGGPPKTGTLRITTTNMLPGYIRKNGVPYSEKAVLTEHFNLVTGAQNEPYLVMTAFVEDPTYLNGPFIRSYDWKKEANDSGWDPTPCLPR